MDFKSPALDKLVKELQRLPGIGSKTAERLAHHILRLSREDALEMADAIRDVKETVTYCRSCFNFAEGELCSICSDTARDGSKICIVEQARDLYAIEKSGSYDGIYHVLLGALAPLDGIEPEDLTVEGLLERVRGGGSPRSSSPRIQVLKVRGQLFTFASRFQNSKIFA